MRRLLILLTAVALLGALAGCGEKDEPETASTGDLTVMSFNVWYGGVSVDLGQIGAAIEAADADIVGVQEPEGDLRRIADAAGLPYIDESLHLISRFPLYEAERGGVKFAYAEVEPNRVVAIANVHLTCCPYGPDLIRDGKSAADVMAIERRLRLPEVKPYARVLSDLADEGVPVFMTGDMNSPSHLDWTQEAVDARDLPYPLEWPASKALADAGIRDSYREAHPDPVATPGLTWTARHARSRTSAPTRRPTGSTGCSTSGPSETVDSKVVGEEGGPDVEVGVTPWGSDHRAVASSFDVQPAAAPDLVDADPRVVNQGERVTLRYTLAGRGGGRQIGVLPGGPGASDRAIETVPVFDGTDHIAPMLGTGTLSPGAYRAALLDADGKVMAYSPFWVANPNARPSIATSKSTYAPGQPVGVSWRNAPGDKLDYVGVYEAGNPNLYDYVGYRYTGALPNGRFDLGKADLGKLKPGRYVANLMLDDGYTILASAPFSVR